MHQNAAYENRMGFSTRLKELRKSTGFTQKQFAEKIGLHRNSYANYELGRTMPMDPTIRSICQEYGVCEAWLRTGQGEMYRKDDDEEQVRTWVQSVFARDGMEIQRRFLLMISKLPPERWKHLLDYARFISGINDEKDQH